MVAVGELMLLASAVKTGFTDYSTIQLHSPEAKPDAADRQYRRKPWLSNKKDKEAEGPYTWGETKTMSEFIQVSTF